MDSAQASYDAAVKKANVNDQQLAVARAQLDKATLALQKVNEEAYLKLCQEKGLVP